MQPLIDRYDFLHFIAPREERHNDDFGFREFFPEFFCQKTDPLCGFFRRIPIIILCDGKLIGSDIDNKIFGILIFQLSIFHPPENILDPVEAVSQVQNGFFCKNFVPMALLEEKIAALQQQMMAMQQLESKLKGIPTEDDKAAFEASGERLHTIGANLQQELMRLSLVNFYYSETLINTFKKLQGGMR